nr:MAG TPA: hypothetical protein [Caudoviricetes sp.]
MIARGFSPRTIMRPFLFFRERRRGNRGKSG